MAIYLKGLALQYYRGIGPELQRLGPFSKFNFFIGANNAGKSIVLNFLANHLSSLAAASTLEIQGLEVYRGHKTGHLTAAIGIPLEQFISDAGQLVPQSVYYIDMQLIRAIAESLAVNGMVWILPPSTENTGKLLDLSDDLKKALPQRHWHMLWNHLTSQDAGSFDAHWFPETMATLVSVQSLEIPKIQLIPAKREIGPSGNELVDLSGRGLIDRLAQIQSPDHDKRHEREDFDKINSFLRKVTGSEEATIEIPHNRQHVLVHMNNKVLPLASLGTGIHEVIMIAAFCTLAKKQILCVEEPEIHLHPILQRKLIRYLGDFTDNQYFIATHSASFIDTAGAAIFHVGNDGEQTRIEEALLKSARVQICADLGYRASDIVQANYVVWVEGPSDRIYLKHWISAVDETLIEGIHYSIMFYGGRLLSHLGADSDEIEEFIALRSLNQNLAIVMDSDKDSVRSHINETKKRINDQLGKGRGISWITAGREIENYIDHGALQAIVAAIYPDVYAKEVGGGSFDHALYFERKAPKKRRKVSAGVKRIDDLIERDVDKVAVARLVCNQAANLDVLDLRTKINELVASIKAANQ